MIRYFLTEDHRTTQNKTVEEKSLVPQIYFCTLNMKYTVYFKYTFGDW